MNQHWYIVINESPYFIQVPLVFNLILFCLDPIQNTILHLLIWSALTSLGHDSFSDFPCFDDLESFEMYWSDIFYNVSQIGFVCLSHD